MIEQFFFTLLATVLWCLGLTATSQEGYALYFLRKPFDLAYEKYEQLQQLGHTGWRLYFYMFIYYASKPLILCITCMASIWGVFWFLLSFHVLTLHLLPYMLLNSLAASFIQTLIWKLYVKIDF